MKTRQQEELEEYINILVGLNRLTVDEGVTILSGLKNVVAQVDRDSFLAGFREAGKVALNTIDAIKL